MTINESLPWVVLLSLLTGCQTTGLYSHQTRCEKEHPRFPEVVICLKDAVNSGAVTGSELKALLDIAESPNSPKLKLYMLRAEQLSQQVQKNEISDLDARVALQQLYVELYQSSSSTGTTTNHQKQDKGLSFMCRDAISRGDQGGVFTFCQ